MRNFILRFPNIYIRPQFKPFYIQNVVQFGIKNLTQKLPMTQKLKPVDYEQRRLEKPPRRTFGRRCVALLTQCLYIKIKILSLFEKKILYFGIK